MHYYLVDPSAYKGKNFEFYQTQLLSLLGEYHINGEVARVTRLRTAEDLVTTAISRGATTVVVVGGDETFFKVISTAHGKNVTLGYIPLDPASEVADILGLGNLEESVAILAKRRVESLDLATIGQTYFFSNIYFVSGKAQEDETEEFIEPKKSSWRRFFSGEPGDVEIVFDGSFRAHDQFLEGCIINSRARGCSQLTGKQIGNPKDGRLDVVLASKLSFYQAWRYRKLLEYRCYEGLPDSTVIHAKEIVIKGPAGLPIFLSGRVVARAPVTVKMAEEKLKIIVGKDREF